MITSAWRLIKNAFAEFQEHGLLSRGAAIAYYTIFCLAPVLIIVIAVAGLYFGHEAAQGAMVSQLSGLMGPRSADLLQAMIESASNREAGIFAAIIGVITLLLSASGVFGEMQSALNVIWKAESGRSTVARLVRARIASLGLVLALGFLLTVSLVINAGLSAMQTYVDALFRGAHFILQAATFVCSFVLISFLFAAIYKVLPDAPIAWRDVIVGAVVTALLFTIGKSLIGLYVGSSQVTTSYGAAGALVVVLLWIYYSAQIFLLGAAFTRAYASRHETPGNGTRVRTPANIQP